MFGKNGPILPDIGKTTRRAVSGFCQTLAKMARFCQTLAKPENARLTAVGGLRLAWGGADMGKEAA
ncbi:MAG: hypothetical protein IJS32_04180 [Kiritimatiellae bacterium]|nr:hypothetical protein [Kiritimatiellia bacterium]